MTRRAQGRGVREETVALVPIAAMPLARERLENDLGAVERCVGKRDFDAREDRRRPQVDLVARS